MNNDETLKKIREKVAKDYGPKYYDRKGNEMDLMEWGRKCEDKDYKVVKQEEIDRYFVSTVWIGLDMKIFRESPKQIFETMIFLIDEEKKDPDDPLYLYQQMYSTEEEAIIGHENALAIVRAQLLIEERARIVASLAEGNAKDLQSEDPDLLA